MIINELIDYLAGSAVVGAEIPNVENGWGSQYDGQFEAILH